MASEKLTQMYFHIENCTEENLLEVESNFKRQNHWWIKQKRRWTQAFRGHRSQNSGEGCTNNHYFK